MWKGNRAGYVNQQNHRPPIPTPLVDNGST